MELAVCNPMLHGEGCTVSQTATDVVRFYIDRQHASSTRMPQLSEQCPQRRPIRRDQVRSRAMLRYFAVLPRHPYPASSVALSIHSLKSDFPHGGQVYPCESETGCPRNPVVGNVHLLPVAHVRALAAAPTASSDGPKPRHGHHQPNRPWKTAGGSPCSVGQGRISNS